ncbi:hypothetical protein B0H10DRAFT_2036413 [Mycena sp. CBHHK59/15]|nr:hypothetical protein B0H10DRAFT_2036413 [Mycena sp. CBHHK59/15]
MQHMMSSMSSPFAPKLGTNYCPRDEEVEEIESFLVEPLLRLKRLDDKIVEMQQAIDDLIEERYALNSYVQAHRALVSPVRRLPLDIIQEIFIACLPTHRNCVMSAREAPVLLGRVCSAWRSISLSTPRLWARLHIVEPTRPFDMVPTTLFEEKLAQRLEVTKSWLGRSGDCPLSLSLDSNLDYVVTPPHLPPPHSNSGQFLQALIPFAARWRHINITISPLALGTLTSLTENDPAAYSVQWDSFGFLRAPKISSFTLHGSNINPSELPLGWDQLTVLYLVGYGWNPTHALTTDIALQILSKCPSLLRCQLLISGDPDGESHITNAIVELPHMFSRLVMPELKHFYFRGRTDTNDPLSLASFLATATRLDTLNIDTESFTPSSLVELLRSLPPSMQRLRITDRVHRMSAAGVLNDDALAILTPSPSDAAPCCPALRELHVSESCTISDEAFLRFITARMAAAPRTLKRVDILPDLQAYMDDGLEVSIRHLPAPVWQHSPWQGLPDAPMGPVGSPWGFMPMPTGPGGF